MYYIRVVFVNFRFTVICVAYQLSHAIKYAIEVRLIRAVLFHFILEPVSLAKTLIRYTSNDARILSFAKNVDCEIYSKSAGSRPDLWGAKVF